ncbi:MAG: DASS family sodium-coupled anion symporter [Pseudomonadota bacterium]|nr:DASS family sodium-coupled anion symporter [Pseudomonadota bacterium]
MVTKERSILFILLVCLFALPRESLPAGGQFFLLFLFVILATVLHVCRITTSVCLGLVGAIGLGLMSMQEIAYGYTNPVAWLVLMAFWIANTVISTGLGKRIALVLIQKLSSHVIGLGYAICLTEFIFASVIPSNVARGGGIVAPIVIAMAEALGSKPGKTKDIAGSYLVLVAAQANNISSAMFLTAMVANPIVVSLAQAEFGVDFSWGTWFVGASVPGLLSLLITPLLIYKINPPNITNLDHVKTHLNAELRLLGNTTWQEKAVCMILSCLLIGWASCTWHGFHPTQVAMLGVTCLLLLQITSLKEMSSDIRAWETLLWLGGIITMGQKLKESGFIAWVASLVQSSVLYLEPFQALSIVWLFYFYTMYLFAGSTTYVTTLLGAVLSITKIINIPPVVVIAAFAYASNLSSCLTNYATGTMVIYYGYGYVDSKSWYKTGFIMSIFHVCIWLGIGSLWWKIIGWY